MTNDESNLKMDTTGAPHGNAVVWCHSREMTPNTLAASRTTQLIRFILLVTICTCSFGCHAIVMGAGLCMTKIQDCMGRITLSGEIVDEDNKPMNGVTFKTTHHKVVDSTAYHPTIKIIDGTFEVNAAGWNHIKISFEKEGYYSQGFRLSHRPPDHLGGYRQPDGSIRIVLKKKSKIETDEPTK